MIKIPNSVTVEERNYLESALAIVGEEPSLETIWALIDLAWEETSCRQNDFDPEKIKKFYGHPVWLLNGLFIEQHSDSLLHREKFAEEVVGSEPSAICDYGGGFGGLARMIANLSPRIGVDLFDPHPHPVSLELSLSFKNLRHVDKPQGPYDVMIATDVFEHVPDPLGEVEKSSRFLRVGGRYLIANCFYPVIKCHLPSTFHFRESFNTILAEMNLKPIGSVVYGTVFEKTGDVLVTSKIRSMEKKSKIRFALKDCIKSVNHLRRLFFHGETHD